MLSMDIPVDEDTNWWRIKAGRGGVLEDDWLDRNIVTTGWGERGPTPSEVGNPEEFLKNDPSHHNQLSKFAGYDDPSMQEGDVVIAYAPEKGHISGIGTVGELSFDEERTFRYLTTEEAEEAQVEDHYYWRPVSWFDWGTPVRVPDLPMRFQVNGKDQIPTPGTIDQYGTISTDSDRIRTLAREVHDAETVEVTGGGFGPERESQIQDWVVKNIRELDLYNPRIEKRTDAG